MKRRSKTKYEPSPALDAAPTETLVARRVELGRRIQVNATTCRMLQNEIDHITSIIRARGAPALRVADHAVIRYMERIKGIDVQAVRDEITERAMAAKLNGVATIGRAKGDAVEVAHEGLCFVVTHDHMVVTIYPHEPEAKE